MRFHEIAASVRDHMLYIHLTKQNPLIGVCGHPQLTLAHLSSIYIEKKERKTNAEMALVP